MKKAIGLVLAAGLLASCAGMSETEQRAGSGAVLGAGGGALIGAIAGNTAMGVAIGAGAGLVGGLLVDKVEKDKEAAYQKGYEDGQAK